MSFKNTRTKWHSEIRQNSPDTPIILVGCKRDIRSVTPTTINKHAARAKVKKLENMSHYVECSSKTGENVNKVFEDAVMAVLQKRLNLNSGSKKNKCIMC